MKSRRAKLVLTLAAAGALAVAVAAVAVAGGGGRVHEDLTGYQEVPALSTPGHGEFRASINTAAKEIRYTETFGDLESAVTQSHIHFENRTNNGPIVVFLCSNLSNGPAGTQACPANGGTISGTIKPADVGGGAAAQGLAAGEFDELVRAIRAGAMYVNVHTTGRPGGEIRAQLDHHHVHNFGDDSKDSRH
jgi:CHRD domain-containing protein